MKSHELEIEITKEGKLRLETRGVKGKACLKYVELIKKIVGTIQAQELTSEYYEPDSDVKISPELRQEERRS
jgi:hypothetical protein